MIKKEFIIWNPKWATGISKIDEQHKHLVEVINKAHTINELKKDGKELKTLLNEVTELARIHFSTEEEYFDETEYPETEMHKEKHAELLQRVIVISNKFDKDGNPRQITEELLHFLRDWLDNHLVKVDHKYIPWLTEHGVK